VTVGAVADDTCLESKIRLGTEGWWAAPACICDNCERFRHGYQRNKDEEIARLTTDRHWFKQHLDEANLEIARLRERCEMLSDDSVLMREYEKKCARVAQLEAALRLLEDEVSDSGRCSSEFGHHVSEPCRKAVRAALEAK
jgi:hypothetical protein